jgi:hypothetical protein
VQRFVGILSAIIALCLAVALIRSIPEPRCADGWDSPSIGRQGACSHHGGVKRFGHLYLFYPLGSILAGYLSYGLLLLPGILLQQRKLRKNPPPPDATTDDIIRYAIAANLPLKIMYAERSHAKPREMIVRPRSSSLHIGTHGPMRDKIVAFVATEGERCIGVNISRVTSLELAET